MNWFWFSGVWLLPITGALGWSAATLDKSVRSVKAMLTGGSVTYSQAEIMSGIIITICPWLILLLVHCVQYQFYNRTDFKPNFKKGPTVRSKDKLQAMSTPVPALYQSKIPDGWTIGRIHNGRYFRIPSDKYDIRHALVVGSPGSYKSTTMLNSLIWNWNFASSEEKMTVFAYDIKGELQPASVLYDDTGKNVCVVNPSVKDANYWGWDIYHGLNSGSSSDDVEARANMIAESLIPISSKENSVFDITARNILVASLIYGFYTDKGFMDSMLQIMMLPLQDLIAEILDNEELCDKQPKLRMYLQSYAGDDSEMIKDAENTMRQNLRIFGQAPVQYMFRDNPKKVSPEQLQSGTSIFLSMDEDKLTQYRTIFNLLTSDVIHTLSAIPIPERNRPNSPIIWLLIDEFANVGKLPGIEEFMALSSRARRISTWIIVQGTSQLDGTYGTAARRTIMQNCEIKIILGSNDSAANKEFSDMAGVYRETKISNQRNGFIGMYNQSENISSDYRPVFDAADFGRLRKEKKMIVFIDGEHYYIDKCPIFMIPKLKRKSDELVAENAALMKGR